MHFSLGTGIRKSFSNMMPTHAAVIYEVFESSSIIHLSVNNSVTWSEHIKIWRDKKGILKQKMVRSLGFWSVYNHAGRRRDGLEPLPLLPVLPPPYHSQVGRNLANLEENRTKAFFVCYSQFFESSKMAQPPVGKGPVRLCPRMHLDSKWLRI